MNEDKKIWLRTKEGQEFFIYKIEKCDMQKELTKTINKLQNNWNELKKWLEEEIKETEQLSREDNTEERKILLGCYNFVKRTMLRLERMQELEQGKDESN